MELDYSNLKVFGCAYYSLLCPYNRHKLEFRSRQCIFIGYYLNHKGYRCLDTSTKCIFIFGHVIFYENLFPAQGIASHMASASNSPLNQGIVPLLSQINEVNNISPDFVTTEPIFIESTSTPIALIAVIPIPSSLPTESTPIVVVDSITLTVVTPQTNSSSSSPSSVTATSPTTIDSTIESTPSPTYESVTSHFPS